MLIQMQQKIFFSYNDYKETTSLALKQAATQKFETSNKTKLI